jgi:hypothetical protein
MRGTSATEHYVTQRARRFARLQKPRATGGECEPTARDLTCWPDDVKRVPTAATTIQEKPMRTMLVACVLAGTFVVPALAQDAPKKGSDADEAFMTGIRKLGVMSGEAYACSSEADKPQVGQGAIDLATQVSLHFGLQAAFIYSGSFGFGTGHDFDHKDCPQAIADFKGLQAKYLGR